MSKTSKHVLFTAILITIVVLLAELITFLVFKTGKVMRFTQHPVTHPYHEYLGWENARNTTLTGTRCGERYSWTIEVDEQGRSITPYLSGGEPDVSVAVVGGSTIFGVGSSNNTTTVPSLLEKELCSRTGLNVEVHNLAVNGYMSFQEMLILERFMAMNRVDIAVSISGKNDAEYAAFEIIPEFGLLPERSRSNAEFIRSIERGELRALPVGLNLFVNRLRRCSHAIDLFYKIIDRITVKETGPKEDRPLAPNKLEVIEGRSLQIVTNYAMMEALAIQNDARFFMFLQPSALTKKTLTSEEKECLDLLDEQNREYYFTAEQTFYEAIRNCKKSFTFHDITRCLDHINEPAFVDESHYLDVAALAIARSVSDVIVEAVVEAADLHKQTESATGSQ